VRKIPTRFTNRSVDMAVSFSESNLNCLLDFMGLRLPCSEPNGWDLGPCVEGIRLSGSIEL
jgi:hypothetical protein